MGLDRPHKGGRGRAGHTGSLGRLPATSRRGGAGDRLRSLAEVPIRSGGLNGRLRADAECRKKRRSGVDDVQKKEDVRSESEDVRKNVEGGELKGWVHVWTKRGTAT